MKNKIVQCVVDGKDCYGWHSEYQNGKKVYYCANHWRAEKLKRNPEKKMKQDSLKEKDLQFYSFLWKTNEHYCRECSAKLNDFSISLFHHILPKRSGVGGFPYFRHEPTNVIILCRYCHSKCESVISYPKMGVYKYCESVKKKLLESVGLEYHSPQLKTTI